MMELPLKNPKPDIDRFVRIIKGEEIPKTPPFVELFLDEGMIKNIGEEFLGLTWTCPEDKSSKKKYWDFKIKVYHALGYDFLWVYGLPVFPAKIRTTDHNDRPWAETNIGSIQSFEDFHNYPWPVLTDEMLEEYCYVSDALPEGMGMFVAFGDGFLEAVMNVLIGYESMCIMITENPSLVKSTIDRAGEVIYSISKTMLGIPKSAGVFIGDDMGYNTATLFSPDFLRENILPWHKKLASAAHEKNQLYMFHSCGKLDAIMPDLINDVKIDAKHSYQNGFYDVCDYKKKCGNEIAILGGVDVDMLCRLNEEDLRKYVRDILTTCMPGGRYALGTGNSVADYIPLENYLIMLDEGLKFSL